MSGCYFIGVLNRLRKSSSESIDNVDAFDPFKEYMHVIRDAEEDLKEILRHVNESGKKTLVLLCGSAGDGKSHLLSYLKNSNSEQLLNDYIVHNDATESSAPDKTAIETLYDLLNGFKDSNLACPGKNIILAINLGVLSNFIESEYGAEFGQLKKYVVDSNILSSKVNTGIYNSDSAFQHISFSDYHMFLLGKNGVKPEYIEDIFEKIVCDDHNNPFYQAYKKGTEECPLSGKCPVRKNYEFFCNSQIRNFIAMMLVKVIIEEKEILTTRELLNYVYDIIVDQTFDFSRFQKSTVNASKLLKEYLSCIMPSTLFDSVDVTSIMNKTRQFDPLLIRDEEADDVAIEYYVAEDVSKTIKKILADSPYADVFTSDSAIEIINSDRTLKSKLFNVLIRTKMMMDTDLSDPDFDNYIEDLFNYNAGRISKLGNLYSDIEEAVTKWCGNESEDNICIDDLHNGLSIYEDIGFDPYLDSMPADTKDDYLQRFVPYIVVEFQGENDTPIRLDIDFLLYKLIKKLKKGYVQTAEDRNNHADFISFISKILKTGSADKRITVLSEDGRKAILEKTKFGIYKFKVVK